MAKAKTPPPYTWIPAPIGWWFEGPFNRRLAHVWAGADTLVRGYIFRSGEEIPCGPYLTEEAAMTAISEELTPKP